MSAYDPKQTFDLRLRLTKLVLFKNWPFGNNLRDIACSGRTPYAILQVY